MNCPRCKKELKRSKLKGIEVDRCPACEGTWLDIQELDQLEDVVLDVDELKGTMIFDSEKDDINCPVCNLPMKKFKYRLYDLILDFCEKQHGYWLDKGEEKRVLELMRQEIKDINNTAKAEEKWAQVVRKVKSPSFWSKLEFLMKR